MTARVCKIAFTLMFLFTAVMALGADTGARDISTLYGLDLSNVDKLMIIAHPDDESFWAGAEILAEDYLVVCITKSNNDVRRNEFKTAMERSGELLIMFKNYEYSRWNGETNITLYNILSEIIEYKNWQKIVTHNPSGEYGHELHIALSRLVTQMVESKNLCDKYWYFGNYYTLSQIESLGIQPTLDEQTYQLKMELINIYQSQGYSIAKHGHMARYEQLIKY